MFVRYAKLEHLEGMSAISDLVGWGEVSKPNIAFIPYLNISSLIKLEFPLPQRKIAVTRQ